MAIAVITIGLTGMANNVFAQPTTSNSANVDQQGQNDGQYGDQSTADDMSEKNSPEGHESSDSASDKDNLQQ